MERPEHPAHLPPVQTRSHLDFKDLVFRKDGKSQSTLSIPSRKKERPSTYASPEDLETVYVDSPHPKSFCAELRRLRHHRAALASGFWRPTPVPRSISDPPSFCGAIERIILPYRCVSDQWAQVDYLFRFLDILNNVTNFSILFGPTWTRPTNETVPCVSSLVRFERIDTNVEPEVEVDDGLLIDLDGDLPFDLQVGIDAYAAFGSWDDQRIDPSGGPEGEPVWQGIDFDYVRMK